MVNYSTLPGWLDNVDQDFLCDRLVQDTPITIVEVGSFLGRSAKFFSLNTHPDTKIHCIDPFEHFSQDITDIKDMFPDHDISQDISGLELFLQLVENDPKLLVSVGYSPAENVDGIMADFVFLDCNYGHRGVRADVNYWWDHVNPGGVLTGHDFSNYNGVPGVITNFCKDNDLELETDNVIYKETIDDCCKFQSYFSAASNSSSCWAIRKI